MAGVYNKHNYLEEMRLALDKWAAHLAGVQNSGSWSPCGRLRLPSAWDFVRLRLLAHLQMLGGGALLQDHGARTVVCKAANNRMAETRSPSHRTAVQSCAAQ
jgi:hypothetical protein